MHAFIKVLLISTFFISCSEYRPLYENSAKYKSFFENLVIKTDKSRTSENIKKEINKMLPRNLDIKYILLLNSNSSTSSTVNNFDGKISGYEIETEVKAKLYRRDNYDKLIYNFEEKVYAPYFLKSDQVLSTLSSRNKAKDLNEKNIAKKIYNSLTIYFAEEPFNAN